METYYPICPVPIAGGPFGFCNFNEKKGLNVSAQFHHFKAKNMKEIPQPPS